MVILLFYLYFFVGLLEFQRLKNHFLILLGMFVAKHQLISLYESHLFLLFFFKVVSINWRYAYCTLRARKVFVGTPFFDKYLWKIHRVNQRRELKRQAAATINMGYR